VEDRQLTEKIGNSLLFSLFSGNSTARNGD